MYVQHTEKTQEEIRITREFLIYGVEGGGNTHTPKSPGKQKLTTKMYRVARQYAQNLIVAARTIPYEHVSS